MAILMMSVPSLSFRERICPGFDKLRLPKTGFKEAVGLTNIYEKGILFSQQKPSDRLHSATPNRGIIPQEQVANDELFDLSPFLNCSISHLYCQILHATF